MRGTGVERSAKITLMEDGVLIAPGALRRALRLLLPGFRPHGSGGGADQDRVAIKFGPQSNGGALNLISSSIPDSFRLAGMISGGAHGTAKGHVRIGDSYDRVGWLFETYQIDTKGFKQLDGGGDTGFKINDYVGKFRFNSGPRSRTLPGNRDQAGQDEPDIGGNLPRCDRSGFRSRPQTPLCRIPE